MIKYVLGFLALAFLVGCAGQTRTETVTRVAIQAATVRVIDGDTERASRVSALVGRVRDQIAGGPDATIEQLETELRGRTSTILLDGRRMIFMPNQHPIAIP